MVFQCLREIQGYSMGLQGVSEVFQGVSVCVMGVTWGLQGVPEEFWGVTRSSKGFRNVQLVFEDFKRRPGLF